MNKIISYIFLLGDITLLSCLVWFPPARYLHPLKYYLEVERLSDITPQGCPRLLSDCLMVEVYCKPGPCYDVAGWAVKPDALVWY